MILLIAALIGGHALVAVFLLRVKGIAAEPDALVQSGPPSVTISPMALHPVWALNFARGAPGADGLPGLLQRAATPPGAGLSDAGGGLLRHRDPGLGGCAGGALVIHLTGW